MKKNILITGATGFVGKRLVSEIKEDYKLYCLVRKTSNLEGLNHKNISFIYGDLLEKESLPKLSNIDLVIHLATSHSKTKTNDIIATKNLLDLCGKNKIRKIIFMSSMASKRKSLDDYGKTKLVIENMIKKSGLKYIIIRPSIIYSENNLSLIGTSLFAIPFIIPVIGNGKYKLSPLYIGDVILTLKKSINLNFANKEYDLASPEKISFNDIIKICKKKFNLSKIIIHLPKSLCVLIFRIYPLVSVESVKGIDEDTNADISKIKKDLKINPIKFREGIRNVNL